MEFLSENWCAVLGGAITAIGIIILLRTSAKQNVNDILFYLVSLAEAQFGAGQGELKYASVVTWLYERLPAVCRFVLSEKEIDSFIEKAVDRLQDYLLSQNDT